MEKNKKNRKEWKRTDKERQKNKRNGNEQKKKEKECSLQLMHSSKDMRF